MQYGPCSMGHTVWHMLKVRILNKGFNSFFKISLKYLHLWWLLDQYCLPFLSPFLHLSVIIPVVEKNYPWLSSFIDSCSSIRINYSCSWYDWQVDTFLLYLLVSLENREFIRLNEKGWRGKVLGRKEKHWIFNCLEAGTWKISIEKKIRAEYWL